ncbi:DNA repair protein [Crucibulum laeve]|uniref:DNA repair protein n=1 Tax=Crucibulum laeve TaxID=68775 RepID=A0A5C3MB94_9AGAR|nr:DNA repair protein [Crucibulum laeve]
MHAFTSIKNQEARVTALQNEIEHLQKELGEDIDAGEIVKRHIKLLHQYNEAKDATQILIGRLATLKETTIRQIHNDYDLPEAD